jgi:hypothetical protein
MLLISSSVRRRCACRERVCLIHSLLVRIHLLIEMTLVDRPCAMGL